MPKIEPSSSGNAILIDGNPYNKGNLELDPTNDQGLIGMYHVRFQKNIVKQIPLSEWTDENDNTFATYEDFVNYLDSFFFRNVGGGGSGEGWSGVVDTFADLPAANSVDPLTVYLVRTKTGSQLTFNLRRSGLYESDGVSTWTKLSNAQFLFSDNELTFSDDVDNTKQLGFQVDQISTSTRRTATWQDKDGTVAYLDDIPSSTSRPVYYQASSTSTQDVNTTTQTLFPFDVEQNNEDTSVFQATSDGVEILQNKAIICRVALPVINTVGSIQRLKVSTQFAADGVPIGAKDYLMYLRDLGGSLRAQAYNEQYFSDVPANTEITVLIEQEEGGGTGQAQAILADTYLEVKAYDPAPQQPPVIQDPTNGQVIQATTGIPGSYQAVATNNPATWILSNQQSGITVSSGGLIQWDGTQSGGSDNMDIEAFNGAGGSGQVNFDINFSSGIPAGAVLVLDGFSLDALGNGAPISSWTDDSGNGNDFEQLNFIDQPALIRDYLGAGNHGVLFNGVNQFLESTTLTSAIFGASPTEGTLYIVFTQNGKTNTQALFSAPRNTGSNINAGQFLNVNLDTNFQTGGGGNSSVNTFGVKGRKLTAPNYAVNNIANGVNILTDYYVRVQFGSGLLTIEQNSGGTVNTAYVDPSYDGDTGNSFPTIGKDSTVNQNYCPCTVSYIAYWDFELSPAEVTAMDTYIQNRFGL